MTFFYRIKRDLFQTSSPTGMLSLSTDVRTHLSRYRLTYLLSLCFRLSVIDILCGMAEFAAKVGDAKFFASVWRCIISFSTGRVAKSIDQFAANNAELACYFDFVLSTVKTCCHCIQYDLRAICQSESSGKLHSKSIGFTASILQRLATAYPHGKFVGHHHVLTTLLILLR